MNKRHISDFKQLDRIAEADTGIYYAGTTRFMPEMHCFRYHGEDWVWCWPRPSMAMKGKLVTKPRKYR